MATKTRTRVVFDVDANIRAVTRMLMAYHEKTAEDVAEAIGIGRNTIYGRLRGETTFSAHEVYLMAELFETSPRVFFEPLGGDYHSTTRQKYADSRRAAA